MTKPDLLMRLKRRLVQHPIFRTIPNSSLTKPDNSLCEWQLGEGNDRVGLVFTYLHRIDL